MSLDTTHCAPWPVDDSCCELPDGTDPDLIERWTAVASYQLWAASGRRYGQCETTIRPCVRRCLGGTFPVPYKGSDGAWRNFSACGCSDDCSCVEIHEVILPGPIYAVEGLDSPIVSVILDGVTLDPSTYRLDRRNNQWRLVSLGGHWPSCQDMTAACDEDGAFCVTYMRGMPLDEGAIAAVSEYACELVKACLPDCVCRLPANVTAMTRRGITVAFDTSQSWIRALPLVASWLDSVNPDGLTSASGVWSPDIAPIRTTPATEVVS